MERAWGSASESGSYPEQGRGGGVIFKEGSGKVRFLFSINPLWRMSWKGCKEGGAVSWPEVVMAFAGQQLWNRGGGLFKSCLEGRTETEGKERT